MRTIAEITAGFLALPELDINAMLKGRRALILAPHPDDESLACGGLIAAACAAGIAPIVVILTDGSASHPNSAAYPPAKLRVVREAEARAAVAELGLPRDNLICLRQADTTLPHHGPRLDPLVTTIERIVRARGCEVIIAPWHGDPHCDHEAAAIIGQEVAARLGLDRLSYPLWGWLRPPLDALNEPRVGGCRLNIAAHLPAKARAIAAHRSQHSGMITDSPDGFFLPRALLAIAARSYEVFIA